VVEFFALDCLLPLLSNAVSLKESLPLPAFLMPTQVHTTPSSSSISLNTYRLALSTAKNFFQDSPWLNIPPHRRAEILIVPLFPRLGLLGGSPAGEGKMSKIAALAARRRQKENEKQNTMNTDTTDAVEDSASSLSRLRSATAHTSYPLKQRPMTLRPTPESTSTLGQKEEFPSPEYPPPTTQEDKDKNKTIPKMDLSDAIQSIAEVAELQAKPSSFARTLMVSPGNALHLTPEPFNPFPQRAITTFDFLKPSPDDMVLKAQNSKGPR
jgi:elongation factor 1 alpha-like protein